MCESVCAVLDFERCISQMLPTSVGSNEPVACHALYVSAFQLQHALTKNYREPGLPRRGLAVQEVCAPR